MATYKTRIILRTDTSANWQSKNPILKVGEVGYSIDNAKVTAIKYGVGLNWNSTPVHITPFNPIVTSYGRNLDSPAAPYNASHNFQTEAEAWDYVLNPYSPPSVSISNPQIAQIEVGDTYTNTTQAFTANFFNTASMFLEGGNKVFFKDQLVANIIDDTPGVHATSIALTDQNSNTTNQALTKSVTANRTTTGDTTVLTVSIRGIKGYDTAQGVFSAIAYVTSRYRSAYFLWKNNDELFAKSDAELSAIIRGIGTDLAGVRQTTFATGGGNKSFGTINFNTAALTSQNPVPDAANGNNGFFDIVIVAPASAGTPLMYNPAAGPTSPITLESHSFQYTNGNATTNYVLYKTVSGDKIVSTAASPFTVVIN